MYPYPPSPPKKKNTAVDLGDITSPSEVPGLLHHVLHAAPAALGDHLRAHPEDRGLPSGAAERRERWEVPEEETGSGPRKSSDQLLQPLK